MRVCLSAEGAKNVSWPLLSPLRGWGSLTMAFTGKLVYIYMYVYIYIYIYMNFMCFVYGNHVTHDGHTGFTFK